MATAPRNLSDEEAHRKAGRLLDVLAKVGIRDGAATRWWSEVAHAELGGRTALQAWQSGDFEPVTKLVEKLASQRFAGALSENPKVAQRLLDQSTPS